MEWPTLRFLHFTDCHFSGSHAEQAGWHALIEHLKRESKSAPLHAAFLTGDISDRNSDAGYTFATDFLRSLSTIVMGGAASIIVVPGNHDVTRDLARALTWNKDQLTEHLAGQARTLAEYPFHKLKDAMSACGATLSLNEQPILLSHVPVRILAFNTAWLARDTLKDRGRLSVALERWERALGTRAPTDSPFSVALLHHSTDWLHESETHRLERLLCKHADVILSGHVHEETHKEIKIDGHNSILITGASIGDGALRFHRAILGELTNNGTLYFHRIQRDPYRAETSDEWSTIPSTQAFPIVRVDERAMASTIGLSHSPVESILRQHWSQLFTKDTLVGFAPEATPRNLLVTYRKLTFAQGADEAGRCNILWSDLQQLLTVSAFGEIAQQTVKIFKQLPISKIDSLLSSMSPPRLSGDFTSDISTLARFVAHTTAMRLLNSTQGDHISEHTLLRALAITPSFVISEAKECATLLEQNSPVTFVSAAWLPLLLLRERNTSHDSHEFKVYHLAGHEFAKSITPLSPKHVVEFLKDYHGEQLARTVALYTLGDIQRLDDVAIEKLRSFGIADALAAKTFVESHKQQRWNERATHDSAAKILYAMQQANVNRLWLDALISAINSIDGDAVPAPRGVLLQLATRAFAAGADDYLASVVLDMTHRIIQHSGESAIDFPVIKRQRINEQSRKLTIHNQLPSLDASEEIIKECTRRAVEDSYQHALQETFSAQSKTLEEIRAEIAVATRPPVLAIIGGPGSGKTTLLRHLCLTCENELPLFVPLRSWNSSASLSACIENELAKANVSLEYVFRPQQRVVLLLDGLDEVRGMNEAKRRELELLISQYLQKQAHIFITTRATSSRWLPNQARQHRYSLNRLTEDDVFEFVRAWFSSDHHATQIILNALALDAGLLEDLKTPFVLRMHCAMLDSASLPSTWQNRTTMYEAILEYLLDKRDRARGLELHFDYAKKRAFLAELASHSFASEDALESINLLSEARKFTENNEQTALHFVREVVERSQILTKSSDTRYDYTHFTLREALAVIGWSTTHAWRTWSDETLRRNLTHESIPRFIVGMSDSSERHWIANTLRRVLKGNPSVEFIVAISRLENFHKLSFDQQLAEFDDFVRAALHGEYIDMDDCAAIFARMYHSMPEASRLHDYLENTITNLVNAEPKTWRRLPIISKVRDDRVSFSLISRIGKISPTLDVGLRTTIAQLGPSLAGRAVRNFLHSAGDIELLRECLQRSDLWARELEESIRGMLSRSDVAIPNLDLQLLDGRRLCGPDDSLDILKRVFTDLATFLTSGKLSNSSVGLADITAICSQLSQASQDALRGGLVDYAMKKKSIDVANHVDVFAAIRDFYSINVTISPDEEETRLQPRASDIIGALVDGASNRCIEILFELSNEHSDLIKAAAHKIISRFEKCIPNDQRAICYQIIDDAWCIIKWPPSHREELRAVKSRRLDHVVQTLRISEVVVTSVRSVVERLPRRPESSDWPLLQYRFGALSTAVGSASIMRPVARSRWSICDEYGWERLCALTRP